MYMYQLNIFLLNFKKRSKNSETLCCIIVCLISFSVLKAMETLTHVPENQQQLIDSIQKCMQEGIMPIMQAGTQVGGHSLLDAEWLTGKQVALINIEKIKVERCQNCCHKKIKL